MVGGKFGPPKFSNKYFFTKFENFQKSPRSKCNCGDRIQRAIPRRTRYYTSRKYRQAKIWLRSMKMYFQILKKSDQTIYNFFPAFDRSIECISHMTYDMDSKTFFCQQNLSETFVTYKKITKKCVSRIYICKNWIFWWFFWRLHFSDSDLSYTLFPSDASRHWMSAQEK